MPPPEVDSSIEARRSMDDGLDIANGSSFAWYVDETSLESERIGKYREYDRMDTESVEIASALDIYADNATSGDRESGTIEVVSESAKVIEVLNEVKGRLKLDFALWSIAREMVKYGDCFEEVVVYPDFEVHRLKHLSPSEVKVKEDEWGRPDSEFPYEQMNETGETIAKFADWQILHFKIAKNRTSKYGVDGSLLYPLRKVFKQLAMIEDSLIIARLTRAQQRFAFMIDVSGIEPGEPTADYLRKVKNSMKKKRTIDPVTGRMDLKYNPLSAEEDIFLARRESNGSDVKVLQGASNLGQLADVEYFSKKLFAGLKVPKAWMGFEGETHARAVITELDVQFAKTIRRVQQSLIEGLQKLFDFVLLTRGIDPIANSYTIKLPVLSAIDELREWQMEVIKANVAVTYKNSLGISSEWVYRNLLELSDEDIEEIKKALEDDDALDNVRAAKAAEFAKPAVVVTGNAQGIIAPDANAQDVNAQDANKAAALAVAQQQEPATEALSARELRVMRYKLREELEALYDLLNWEVEAKTGTRLKDGNS
jgi:hypothetical protein